MHRDLYIRHLALHRAIRYFGSQEALAKTIRATRRQVLYWLNESAEIPYKYVLEIERATQQSITRYELAPQESSLNRYLDQHYQKSICVINNHFQCQRCKNSVN